MFPSISNAIIATIAFLFFLLPGFTLLRRFWGSEKGELQTHNIYSHFVWATPVSIGVYWCVFSIIGVINKKFGVWLIAVFPDKIYNTIIGKEVLSQHHIYELIKFILVSSLFAALFGRFLQKIISRLDWDTRFVSLKFSNDWYYVLSGQGQFKYPFFRGWFKHKRIMVDAVVLSVVDDTPVLYQGFVKDFSLKKDGDLDFVILFGVKRFAVPGLKVLNKEDLKSDLPSTTHENKDTSSEELPNPDNQQNLSDNVNKSPITVGNELLIRGEEIKNIKCEYSLAPSFPKEKYWLFKRPYWFVRALFTDKPPK